MRLISILAAASLAGALCLAAHAEEIRVGGGAAPMENIFKKVKAAFEKQSGIQLVLSADGPDKAFIDVESGRIDVATAGLTMKDWLDLMKQKGHEVANPMEFRNRVIGRDKIQVLAHKGLAAVKSLDKDQLKAIFSGKARSWKEFGGPDLPIVLVYGSKIPGTNKLWQEKILDGAEWAKVRVEAGDAADVRRKVVETPGAVGVGPLAAEDLSALHSPDSPEVGRPITAVTKGAPSPKVQKLFDFIAGEGQALVAR